MGAEDVFEGPSGRNGMTCRLEYLPSRRRGVKRRRSRPMGVQHSRKMLCRGFPLSKFRRLKAAGQSIAPSPQRAGCAPANASWREASEWNGPRCNATSPDGHLVGVGMKV